MKLIPIPAKVDNISVEWERKSSASSATAGREIIRAVHDTVNLTMIRHIIRSAAYK
jgi:hypothetical protein